MIARQPRGVELLTAIQAEVLVALEQRAVGEQRDAVRVPLAAISHRDDRADLELRAFAGLGIDAAGDGKTLFAGLPAHPLAGVQRHRRLPVNPSDWQSACIEFEDHGSRHV